MNTTVSQCHVWLGYPARASLDTRFCTSSTRTVFHASLLSRAWLRKGPHETVTVQFEELTTSFRIGLKNYACIWEPSRTDVYIYTYERTLHMPSTCSSSCTYVRMYMYSAGAAALPTPWAARGTQARARVKMKSLNSAYSIPAIVYHADLFISYLEFSDGYALQAKKNDSVCSGTSPVPL